MNLKLSKEEAQRIVLNAQGLINGFDQTVDSIRRLSYVQIDTIAVAERSHHHVLYTRNRKYHQSELGKMMSDKSIFEYWSHAAAFLPIEDYRFSLYPKAQILKDDKFWFEKNKKTMRYVLKRIKEEGPLQSKDFKDIRNEPGGWYEWKPAKIALSHLFMEGRIMVAERQGFQKIYDLTERVLPEGINQKKPTQLEYCKYLILRSIDAQGLVSESEMGYLRKGIKAGIKSVLRQMLNKKELISVKLEGTDELYYSKNDKLHQEYNTYGSKNLHILSPFDNLIIQRKRTLQIFDFDYQIECYLPEHKRTYGYFTLPILFGQKIVGRLDPKADRKTGVFCIKSLWFEDDFLPGEEFLEVFRNEVLDFASFSGCDQVKLEKVIPVKFKKLIVI